MQEQEGTNDELDDVYGMDQHVCEEINTFYNALDCFHCESAIPKKWLIYLTLSSTATDGTPGITSTVTCQVDSGSTCNVVTAGEARSCVVNLCRKHSSNFVF